MNLFHKIISVTLSIIVLISTSSFTVESHYCGDVRIDSSIFGKASKCMCEEFYTTNNSDKPSFENGDCCLEKVIVYGGNDEVQENQVQVIAENILFLHSNFYSYINLCEGFECTATPFIGYSPPILITNLQVIHASFLI